VIVGKWTSILLALLSLILAGGARLSWP